MAVSSVFSLGVYVCLFWCLLVIDHVSTVSWLESHGLIKTIPINRPRRVLSSSLFVLSL